MRPARWNCSRNARRNAAVWVAAFFWCAGWIAPLIASATCEMEHSRVEVCPHPGPSPETHGPEIHERQVHEQEFQRCGIGPCHSTAPDIAWMVEADLATGQTPRSPAAYGRSVTDGPERPRGLRAPPPGPPPRS